MKQYTPLLAFSKRDDLYLILAEIAVVYNQLSIISEPKYTLTNLGITSTIVTLRVTEESLICTLVDKSRVGNVTIPMSSHDATLLLHDMLDAYGIKVDARLLEERIRVLTMQPLLKDHHQVGRLAHLFMEELVLGNSDAVLVFASKRFVQPFKELYRYITINHV